MGGKTKTSQRTKNNARPASSGRSADLLNNAANLEQYFGASLGKPVLFASTSFNIDQGLTPEHSVCFKKFNKKDPITKIKALQELTALIKTGNVEDVEAALPSWAHHYQPLSIDSDRRVREATQACHSAVVGACGRRVAPQLRRLLPVWLLALHDEHAPAASVALALLHNTFPDSKLTEALTFCKSEIVTLLKENLTGNADAMIGKKAEDEEERQLQVTLVVAGSLRALQLIIVRLSEAHDDLLWESLLLPLLQHNYFWGLVRHQSQHIRASWYGAVARTIERFSARMPLQVGRRMAKALVAEPERGAGVASQRWATLLLLMKHAEDWHTWMEKKDLLITRLLDMIENGAWGEARLLADILLPLLASLPADLLTKQFYIRLFDAMFTGLNNKNLLSSKSERQTWITIMTDCLRYLSSQNQEHVIEVITYVHRTWLETILQMKEGQAKNNLITHSVTNMTSLVKYWLAQSKVENEKYDQLTRNFWQNFCSTIITQIDKLFIEQEDITHSLESHILLLKSLKTSFLKEPRKKLSIQFEDQKMDQIDVKCADIIDVQVDAQTTERFKHSLSDLVVRTCYSYLDFACIKQVSQWVCPLLTDLLVEFDSRELFAGIAKQCGAGSVYGWYDAALRPWLAGDTMRCQALVEMVFLVVKYLSEEEQDSMFNSFQQFPPLVIEWCIQLSLSHPHRSLPAGRRWMRGPVVEATVLSLCKREEDNKATRMLLACISYDEAGELIVSETAVVRVVRAMSERLQQSACDAPLLVRAAELAVSVARGSARAHVEPLLLAMFRQLLQLTRGTANADAAVREEVWEAWREALPALPARLREQLQARALRDLADHVFYDVKELDVKRIEDAASFCPHLFSTTADNMNISDVVSLAELLLTRVQEKQPTNPLELPALKCDCIQGNISTVFERTNELVEHIASRAEENYEDLSKDDLITFAYKSVFRLSFLRSITQKIPSDGDDKCDDDNTRCDLLLRDAYFQEQLSRVLYEYAVISTLHEYYAFWPHYEIIHQTKQEIESLLQDILVDINVQTKNAIYTFLTELLDKKGIYWATARKLFEIQFNKATAKKFEPNETLDSSILDQTYDDYEISDNIETMDENDSILSMDNAVSDTKEEKDPKTNPEHDPNANTVQISPENKDTIQQNVVEKDALKSGENRFKVERVDEPKLGHFKALPKCENSNTVAKSHESEAGSTTEANSAQSGSESHTEAVQWADSWGFSSLQEVLSNSSYYLNLLAEAKYSPEPARDHATRFKVMLLSICARDEPALTLQLLADTARLRDAGGADPVVSGYYKHRALMLFERSLNNVPWMHVVSNAAIVDYLADHVALRGRSMEPTHWDFVNIALGALLHSVAISADDWACTNVATLFRATSRLLGRVYNFMHELRCSLEPLPARLATLLQEWDEIFVPDINKHLFTLLSTVLRSTDTPMTASSVTTIGSLIAATKFMEWETIRRAAPQELGAESFARDAARTLLGMNHHAYKYLAFYTLQLMAKPLVLDDAEKLEQWKCTDDDDKEDRPRPDMCFVLFDDAMNRLQEYTEAALSNVKLGEGTCEMVPFSDSHCVSLGYMLLAAALLRLCRLARGDLNQVYISEFRERRHAEGLMSCALRLLPGSVAAFAFEDGAAPHASALRHFHTLPDLDVYRRCGAGAVGALACGVLTETLGGAGAAGARGWCGAAGSQLSAALRRLVAAAVAPVLLRRHLRQLRDRAHELPDTRVTILWSSGEVQCVLRLEEQYDLEMSLRFAPEHPLVPPSITLPPKTIASDASWMVMYLTYQNGTLLNMLKMWIQAVNSKLQKAPQCYVCYCRLNPATGRLPNVTCRTCRNKFHRQCLSKWFKTSKKQYCPLCRSKFLQ